MTEVEKNILDKLECLDSHHVRLIDEFNVMNTEKIKMLREIKRLTTKVVFWFRMCCISSTILIVGGLSVVCYIYAYHCD
jgi:hypothetical protein